MLFEDEIARAKLMAPIPGRRFVETCSVLRRVLSAYTGVNAASMQLAHDTRGKPWLVPDHPSPDLQFSVSHASDRAILAIGRSDLGIDNGSLRAFRDVGGLASRFLALDEARALRCGPTAPRELAVRGIWTRKEADAKALGEGTAIAFQPFGT